MLLSNALLLHPLSGTRAAMVWHSGRNGVRTLSFFCSLAFVSIRFQPWKKKREKTSGFIWKITNKVLTFAPAFKKKAAIFGILIWRRCKSPFAFILPFAREMTRKKWSWKERLEKKLPVLFGGYMKKSLPLHPLSEKNESLKRSDLWTDLHKQYK